MKKGDDPHLDTLAEQYSYRYLGLIATQARASFQQLTKEEDNDGVDVQFGSTAATNVAYRAAFQAQVKSCRGSRLTETNDGVSYRMDTVHYKKLFIAGTLPRMLIVVELNSEHPKWVTEHASGIGLVATKRAFWFWPQNDESNGMEKVTCKIPKSNLFTGAELLNIFQGINEDKWCRD
jgi:hypothetical protein